MRNYQLNIADYSISIEAADDKIDLVPGRKFKNFISASENKKSYSLSIKVHYGSQDPHPLSKCVFHAPYVEEIDGKLVEQDPDFWSIWKHNQELYIKSAFPTGKRKALLKLSLSSMNWVLFIDAEQGTVDPLEYPLDGLILYYLAALNGDILIHASGVNHEGNGYLFSGISGKGKTTMASLWEKCGGKVIHDDRLILKKTCEGWKMYNTPVYDNEISASSKVNKIYIIDHGSENKNIMMKDSAAISAFMTNCIQHNWNHDLISGLLHSVSEICSQVQVSRLSFRPDISIVDYILKNE
jgi:hypothetical protein